MQTASESAGETAAIPSLGTPAEQFPYDCKQYTCRRSLLCKEILSTEMTYVSQLKYFLDTFVEPLDPRKSSGKVLTQQDFRVLGFHLLQQILPINQVLLEGLSVTIGKNWSDSQKFANRWNSFIPFLKIYGEFTNAYSAALTKLDLLTNACPLSFGGFCASFTSMAEEFERKPETKGLTIGSFMILPIQRIPRYVLFFKELMKCTHSSHPDYDGLTKAAKSIEEVAASINEAVSIGEGRRAVFELQQCVKFLPFNLIEPHRYVIRKGWLTKQSRDKDNERYFVLFNDYLMYAEELPVSGMYRFLQILPLDTLIVTSLPDDVDPEATKSDSRSVAMSGGLAMFQTGRKNIFRIQSEKESFVVCAQTPASKVAWLEVLQSAISKCPSAAGGQDVFRPAVWMQDQESRVCMSCNRIFDTFHRRHHCRRCGLLFCKNCCKTKVMLSRSSKKPERVCNDCSSILKRLEATARESFQKSQGTDRDERRTTSNSSQSVTTVTSLEIGALTDLS